MKTGNMYDAFLEVVRETLKERGVGRAEVSLDLPLAEEGLGLDSISRLTLLGNLETEFGIDFPEEYWGTRTFRDLKAILSYIENNHG